MFTGTGRRQALQKLGLGMAAGAVSLAAQAGAPRRHQPLRR